MLKTELTQSSTQSHAVRESANKSAARAASPVYVKFQAVIKSAASAASLRGGRASGRLDHGLFFAIFGRASGQKIAKNHQNLGLCYPSLHVTCEEDQT